MKIKIMKSSVLALFCITAVASYAQQSTNASGGNALGGSGSASYSVGQVVNATIQGKNGTLAQGVQQTYKITVLTGVNEAKGINLTVSAYPNPTTDYLILKIENDNYANLSYQFFDLHGKLLESKKIEGSETSILTSNLLRSTYFLKVTQDNKELKTFKIIKF
jgi:hypothetical protein